MGKKSKDGKEKLGKNPLVSIITPTFNRRPFYPMIIQCFQNQTYPKDKMEWIIIDDGTDKIEDLVKDIPQVKYFKYDEKMTLGRKRNLAHEKASGDILVYMDDDDYYPPERVRHAVDMLRTTNKALCAGSSEMFIYFKHLNKMLKFGPYGANHSTAATFAFKKELLKITKYDDDAALAEEKNFLKDYTIPFVQLDPKKTILVFSHNHNSFDKKKLLENVQIPNKVIHYTDLTVDDLVKEPEIKKFFMEDIDGILDKYEPGKPHNKQDVLKQIDEITEKRNKINSDHIKQEREKQENYQKLLSYAASKAVQPDGTVLEDYKKKIMEMGSIIEQLTMENNKLKDKMKQLIAAQIQQKKAAESEKVAENDVKSTSDDWQIVNQE